VLIFSTRAAETLARADSGRETLNMQPVNLSETLRGIVEGWQHVAPIRSLLFSVNLEAAEAYVMGDEMALRRLAGILLDNAFRYTPPPGGVSLTLEQNPQHLVMKVRTRASGSPLKSRARFSSALTAPAKRVAAHREEPAWDSPSHNGSWRNIVGQFG